MFIDFKETRKGREWDRNIDLLPLERALTGDLTLNLGVCPDQGSSLFRVRDDTPTN